MTRSVTHERVDSSVPLEVQDPRVRILLRLDQAGTRARRRLRMIWGRRRRRRRRYVGRAIKFLLIARDIGGGLRLAKLLRLSGYQRLRGLNYLELIVPAEERPISRRSLMLLRERVRERDSEGGRRRGSERRDLVCTC